MSIISTAPTVARLRRVVFPAVAGSVLALTAACGGAAAPAAPSVASAPAASTPEPASAGGAATVTVTETDFALALDRPSLPPGHYTFHVVNSGRTEHALELEGPGVDEQKTAVLHPGQSADLSAQLQAGDYDLYCPVDGHRGMGMEAKLTVGGAGAAPSGGGSGY
jgi:uncharacterized cupredoxin-like copper-binding protein